MWSWLKNLPLISKAFQLSDAASKQLVRHQARSELVRIAGRALEREAEDNPVVRRDLTKKLLQTIEEKEEENTEKVIDYARELAPKTDLSGVDEDWLFRFLDEARKLTREDMQLLLGKVLAGELRTPGSYQIRSVVTLVSLSEEQATAFQKFCNLSFSADGGAFVILGVSPLRDIPEPRHTVAEERRIGLSLEPYGLPHSSLLELNSIGLIASARDGQEYPDLYPVFADPGLEFAGTQVRVDVSGRVDADLGGGDAINVISLTAVGRELRKILSLEVEPAYADALEQIFEEGGIRLICG